MADNSIEIVARLEGKFDDFMKQFDALEGKVDKGSKKMSASFKAVGEGLHKASGMIVKSTAIIGGAIAGVTGFLIKMGSDANESENLFEVSFGNMSEAARKWSDDYSKAVGASAFESRKNAATLNAMVLSMGASEDAAFKMSTGLVELSNDMASFYNLKPEEAFEKLRSGISGEAEPLKQLGVLINETSVQAYALANGIGTITEKNGKMSVELSETEKVYARYGLIMQQTQKAQGDLARTADSTANIFRSTKNKVFDTLTEIGMMLNETFQEAIAKVAPRIREAMDGFLTYIEGNKAAIQDWFAMILDKGVNALTQLLDWVSKNKDAIGETTRNVFEFMKSWGPLIANILLFIVVSGQLYKPLMMTWTMFGGIYSVIGKIAKSKMLLEWAKSSGSALMSLNDGAIKGVMGLAGMGGGGFLGLAWSIGLIVGTAGIGWAIGRWIDKMTADTRFGKWVDDMSTKLVNLIDKLKDWLGLSEKAVTASDKYGDSYEAVVAERKRREAAGLLPPDVAQHAIGGFTQSNLQLLGEHGPEIAKLPKGTQIYRASQTMRMMTGGGGININVPVTTNADPEAIARAVGSTLNRMLRRAK